jgi:hypothetical protein
MRRPSGVISRERVLREVRRIFRGTGVVKGMSIIFSSTIN